MNAYERGDRSVIAIMNSYYEADNVECDERDFDNNDLGTVDVKPRIAVNDVGSTSYETSKRCQKKRCSGHRGTEMVESSCCEERMQLLLDSQQMQSAVLSRIATAIENMVSESAKKIELEERRLVIAERKIAVSERKALINERRIAVEERRVAAEEHLLHCGRTYLQDRKTCIDRESEPVYHHFSNADLRPPPPPPPQSSCQHAESLQSTVVREVINNFRPPSLPDVEVEITVNPDFVTTPNVSEELEGGSPSPSNTKSDISELSSQNTPIPVGETQGQKVHIGSNIWILTDQWNSIQHKHDSLFCKLLATALWTPAELRESSVCGMVSNRVKNSKRKRQLSPLKVGVIRERLYDKLRRTIPGISETEIIRRGKLVNKYLAEKIASINKISRKTLDYNI